MTDRSDDSPEEDAASLRSNGSLKRSLQQSFKPLVSPNSSNGSKVKPKADGTSPRHAASPAGHDDDASDLTDRPNESPEENTVSLSSNGKTPTSGSKGLNPIQLFRQSMRRIGRAGPSKGAKVDTGSSCPPSPSPSSLSNDVAPQQEQSLKRSQTDPSMTGFESLGRTLKLGSNKGKKKASRPMIPVFEGATAEKEEEKEAEEKPEEKPEELEETYTLPEIPHNPLSVMQINKLIVSDDLEDAHVQLLALRLEFQQEHQHSSEDSPVELVKKEKDLILLYGELRERIRGIVRSSSSRPPGEQALLITVARIIQEEEKRAEEPGGLQGGWMETWREAVAEGVKANVESVPLEAPEQNTSWLSVHLGQLGKTIVEDLGKVKDHLRWCYPPSFGVFTTYLRSYHSAVGEHVKKLEPSTANLRDLYALLDWILNVYKSECMMGNPSLQPNMAGESMEMQLDDDFLPQLKSKYCSMMVNDFKFSLQKVIEMEKVEFWDNKRIPRTEDDLLFSQFPMDIWTRVEINVQNSGRIDAELQQEVTSFCLTELRGFPERFHEEFFRSCGAPPQDALWAEYQITYINSFARLQEYMQNYHTSCPDEVEAFRKKAQWLVLRLTENLEEHFKKEMEPYLRRMLTRKWLTSDDDFKLLLRRIEQLSLHATLMTPPHAKELASRLHYHVMREYVGQMMKNNYSCKNRKHVSAAEKIRAECSKLRKLFEDMDSRHEWLGDVGDDLSDIIGQKNNADIKNHLQPVVGHYADFSRKHLVAVLNFRGLLSGREYRRILQRHRELREKGRGQEAAGGESQRFFNGMLVTVRGGCLSNLPDCFSACINQLPNN